MCRRSGGQCGVAIYNSLRPFDVRLGSLLVSLAPFMAVLDVSEEPFEVDLVLGRALMLLPFEGSVFDIGAAVFAPVLGLVAWSVIHTKEGDAEQGCTHRRFPVFGHDEGRSLLSEEGLCHRSAEKACG